MAKYSAVKATVNAYIKQNGRKEITGRILNAVLNATIDSLGKYFQFAGGALPTDDPGTPDQNVCYLAGEPGVYTNFGGITIENEEVALLFWDGEWTKQRILIGIREVNASVDSQVGTPSVDVSYSGGEMVLTFHNLKGEQGETGDPAGFGTIGADINGGVGTPGVSVETSGDNTAKNLMFHFTNLKGETGVTSVVATIDDTSGAPSCQVSLVGQQLTLAFSGLKGLKGDTGVSADYPITIYNGLDSDATDQALAAAQGKVLDGKVSQLQQEVDALEDGYIVPAYTLIDGSISPYGSVSPGTIYKHTSAITVVKGQKVKVSTAGYAFALISRDENGTYTPLMNITTGDADVPATYIWTAPENMSISVTVKSTITYKIEVESIAMQRIDGVEAELGQKVSREEIIGNGNTYVSQDIYGLVPGHSYRVYLLNKNYDRSGVTLSGSGWAWFGGENVKSDNTTTPLFGAYAPYLPKSYYDFVLPTDTKYISIGCRATQGEKVGFTIEDLTEVIPMFRPVGVTTLSQLIDMGLTFTQGSFNSSGKESANTGRVRCDKALPTDIGVIAAPDGFVIHEVYYYSSWTDDSNFTFVGPHISVGAKYYRVETSQPLFRFSIRKVNNETITPKELYAALPLSALASPIGFISLMRNGTLNNPLNARCVTTPVINTCGRNVLGINITRPNTPGYHYVFDYALSSSYNDIGVTNVSTQWDGRILMVENVTENTFDFSAYPSAVGVAFAIAEKDDSNNVNPLRKEDFNGYKIELVYLGDMSSIETQMRNFAFNSVFDTADIDNKCKEFSALLNNSGTIETFAFMTDPHLLGVNNSFNKDTFKIYIGRLQKYYNMLPIDWMICGGDWLNQGDYQAEACWKLGYMDATMRKLFKHYFPILGNHDTNYQGTISADDSSRGDLTHQTLVNLMFREEKNTYYEWNGNNTRFFVLDSELDWGASQMDSFSWEQISWLAGRLLTNTNEHIVLLTHIYYYSGTIPSAMADNLQLLAGAFNGRTSVTLNGVTYDFSNAQGTIHCIIAGHTHADYIVTDSNVPVWITTNMQAGGTPTFDLCLIDYTANEMRSIRVGTGSDRTMQLA